MRFRADSGVHQGDKTHSKGVVGYKCISELDLMFGSIMHLFAIILNDAEFLLSCVNKDAITMLNVEGIKELLCHGIVFSIT